LIYNLGFKLNIRESDGFLANIFNNFNAMIKHAKFNIYVSVLILVIILSAVFPIKNLFHRNFVLVELKCYYSDDVHSYSEDLGIKKFGEIENKSIILNKLYKSNIDYEGDLDHTSTYFTFKQTYHFLESEIEYVFYYIFEEFIFYFTYVFIPIFIFSPLIYEAKIVEEIKTRNKLIKGNN